MLQIVESFLENNWVSRKYACTASRFSELWIAQPGFDGSYNAWWFQVVVTDDLGIITMN